MANLPPCLIKRAEIIESLRKNQPCTANELAKLTGEPINAMCPRLTSMVRDGLVTIQRPTSKPNLYSLPFAGIVTGPRQYVSSGTYTGPDWAQSAGRPGAMDHLRHPSRRGDALVPHTGRMVSMVGAR